MKGVGAARPQVSPTRRELKEDGPSLPLPNAFHQLDLCVRTGRVFRLRLRTRRLSVRVMLPWGAVRRCFELDWFVFAVVFAWKLALLAFTGQPIPGGDAFFYDGP